MTDEVADAAAQLGTRAVSNTVIILGARVLSRVVSLVVVIVLASSQRHRIRPVHDAGRLPRARFGGR